VEESYLNSVDMNAGPCLNNKSVNTNSRHSLRERVID